MNEIEKKKITERLSARVSTGLMFIEFNYLDKHSAPDSAWIRNIYILLSFYTELLLKQILVINRNFESINELDIKLRKLGHDLVEIGNEIGKDELLRLGIKKIGLVKKEYYIETESGNFYVKDFKDIRYDFLDDNVRILKGDEHLMFDRQIKIMIKINNVLKASAWR